LEVQSKQISDNSLQVLAVKVTTQTIHKGISVLTKRIDEVNKSMAAVTTSLKNNPSKRELPLHAHTMEEQIAQVGEVNTGLTTAMEGYQLSQSSLYDFRRTSVTAGPSGTQFVHLQRQAAFDQQSISVSSLRDTETEYSWHGRIRGGAGSDGAAGGTTDGPDSRADGGAAG
jgi:hypothetical protein